jgi:hypothetical protein
VNIPHDLLSWLEQPHDRAPADDVSGRATDPIAERLLTLIRPLRAACTTVAGAVVVHHPSGTPFAAAVDGCLVVRTRAAPGTLPSRPVDGLDGWLALDPFPPDVAFARGEEVLRHVLARACDDAGH